MISDQAKSRSRVLESSTATSKQLLLGSLFFLICLAFLVGLSKYSKKAQAVGVIDVRNGLTRLYPRAEGIIETVHVASGEQVEVGQQLIHVREGYLAKVDELQLQETLRLLTTRIDLLDQQKQQLFKSFSNDQLLIETEMSAVKNQRVHKQKLLETQESILRIAESRLKNAEKLLGANSISAATVSDYKVAYLNATKDLSLIVNQQISLQDTMNTLVQKLSNLSTDYDQKHSNIAADRADILLKVTSLKAQSAYIITSPISGSILDVQAQTGEQVSAKQALVTLAPRDTTLHAKLYVPAKNISFVKVGDKVEITYDAFPKMDYGTFPATITKVGQVVLRNQDISSLITLPTGHYVVCEAALKDQTLDYGNGRINLQSGMSFSSLIVFEERSIFSWLTSPIKHKINSI